jgi:transcriptional regulator with XRE-family HTH domain
MRERNKTTKYVRTRTKNDLRIERRKRQLSRKEAASLLGCSVRLLAYYESGYRTPPLITALRLQILYRGQLAAFYAELYRELTVEMRAKESESRERSPR